jgi:hypothetical protein
MTLLLLVPVDPDRTIQSWAGTPAIGWVRLSTLQHFCGYSLAAVLVAAAYGPRWLPWMGLYAHGLLIELVQQTLPFRGFEWSDLAADWLGLTWVGLFHGSLVAGAACLLQRASGRHRPEATQGEPSLETPRRPEHLTCPEASCGTAPAEPLRPKPTRC